MEFQVVIPVLISFAISVVLGPVIIPFLRRLKMGQTERTEGEKLIFPVKEGIVSEETSKEIREILETVVSQGSGKNAKIEGYAIGGKTATSQTLPRSANRYISSFLGFAPAEDPQILGLCIIHDPKGIYYGGTVAAPVIRGIFENILPYLGIEKSDVSDFSAEGN